MRDEQNKEEHVTEENRMLWKEVDTTKPWVVFDMEETLLGLLDDPTDTLCAFFNREGVQNWLTSDKSHLVVLRPGANELLADLGRDYNIALLSTADTHIVNSVMEANHDFARLFCLASGKDGIDNEYYEKEIPPPESLPRLKLRPNDAAKHPLRIKSNSPKVLVDDTDNELWHDGNLWDLSNVGFVKVTRSIPDIKNDRTLFSIESPIRAAMAQLIARNIPLTPVS
ncbi:hypothetical protein MUP32_00710 [Candidatus Microgenomates bacterium]|nr:hypothetical protein [Candidatus Microgenomates bacterium]